MISIPDRRNAVTLINEAVASGARLSAASAEMGICRRTYRRWLDEEGEIKGDCRPDAKRPTPANALAEEERATLIEVACRPEFASLPPSQIVPILADRGEYLASESTFYRVLKAQALQHHRGRAATPGKSVPKRHQASGPNEVWVWDITWLPGPVLGTYYYRNRPADGTFHRINRSVTLTDMFKSEHGDEGNGAGCESATLAHAGRGLAREWPAVNDLGARARHLA